MKRLIIFTALLICSSSLFARTQHIATLVTYNTNSNGELVSEFKRLHLGKNFKKAIKKYKDACRNLEENQVLLTFTYYKTNLLGSHKTNRFSKDGMAPKDTTKETGAIHCYYPELTVVTTINNLDDSEILKVDADIPFCDLVQLNLKEKELGYTN